MVPEPVRRELRAIVGPAYVHDGPAELIAYSYDGTFQQQRPDVAVSPRTTEEVAQILALAHAHAIPVVPRGAASGLAGGVIPLAGGIVLNLARMNRILDLSPEDGVAVVEAGVITAQLQAAAEARGLFYPPDPASLNQSSLGGNVATNAGGPRCLKYGATRDYVRGLTVVLADGRVLRPGGRVLKQSTGYQLTQLFVGSEGTLGVVTEIILRLLPLPRERATARLAFASLDAAAETVTTLLTAGLLPTAIELLDRTTISLVADYLPDRPPPPTDALLIVECDGTERAAVAAEIGRVAELARHSGALEVRVATAPAERAALWEARRAISPALGRLRPNKLGEDIVVPRSQIPAMVRRITAISAEVGLPIPVFGHAGDGNLHPNILFDRRVPGELERVERAAGAIFEAAIALGGTLSGEHGIGSLKREFMAARLAPEELWAMRALKQALDPKGILNPGKLFPTRPDDRTGWLAALPTLDGVVPCSTPA
ncbi:MAG TPA: FAD-linked oxidase C-terminal domain-containing protein [Chloroflexota bacterium]|jgi:glycolate oxidase|nr:FAD-linked oxidase C-terminal domain-containing protein [Chloroflexota bacterium]